MSQGSDRDASTLTPASGSHSTPDQRGGGVMKFVLPTLIGMAMFLIPIGTQEWFRIGERVVPRPAMPAAGLGRVGDHRHRRPGRHAVRSAG